VAAAEALVALVAADLDLGAAGEDTATRVAADDHGGLAAAVTDGADLSHLVGEGEEGGRAGEELAAEVDAQAIGHHRDMEVIHGAGELPDLGGGEELRLVHEDAGDGAFGEAGPDALEQVVGGVVGVGGGLDADAAADAALAGAGVEAGGQEIGLHPRSL
jgi:hypothetical protein